MKRLIIILAVAVVLVSCDWEEPEVFNSPVVQPTSTPQPLEERLPSWLYELVK